MKKIYKIIIWTIVLGFILYAFLLFPIEIWVSRELLWNNYLFPIIVNIVVYIIRTIILGIIYKAMQGKVLRFIISVIVNFIWAGFLLWLVFNLNTTYALAITSFLIVAISLTFQNRINNIVSGAMIIITEGFGIGDLIETNGIEGIVEDISLNYTKIRRFDGIQTLLPNQKVFNSKVTKFTYKTEESDEESSEEENLRFLEKYGGKISHIISKGKKITRYIKVIEIEPTVKPNSVDELLQIVFDKYEPLLGFRPIYYINRTTFNRVSITLQLIGENPDIIMLYVNSFLRDVLYILYKDEVFYDWDGDLPDILIFNKKEKGDE